MTTLILKAGPDGFIATDKRCTADNAIINDTADKFYEDKRILAAFAGIISAKFKHGYEISNIFQGSKNENELTYNLYNHFKNLNKAEESEDGKELTFGCVLYDKKTKKSYSLSFDGADVGIQIVQNDDWYFEGSGAEAAKSAYYMGLQSISQNMSLMQDDVMLFDIFKTVHRVDAGTSEEYTVRYF